MQSIGSTKSEGVTQEMILRQVFLKNVSFTAPGVPHLRTELLEMENVLVNVQTSVTAVAGDLYELVLAVDVHAKKSEKTMCHATVEEVGTFSLPGCTLDEAREILRTKGAQQIFPYAREFLMSMFSRCGLQQLALQPLSFDLYQ